MEEEESEKRMGAYGMKPLISVVMSVYNEEKFLDESIQSILNQTFKDFELIMIDDFSTDNSLEIMKSYKDERIKIIDLKENLGCPNSRNEGLKIAKGKYIALLDGDDISLKKRLEKQFNYLENNSHIFLVGSSAIYINEDGKEIRRFRKYDDYEMLAWRLPRSCSIVLSSIMFRNKNKIYDIRYKGASDYKFLITLLEEGKNLSNIPEFLIKYRVHSNSMSVYNEEEQNNLFKRIKEESNFVPVFKFKFLFKLLKHYLKTRNEKMIQLERKN